MIVFVIIACIIALTVTTLLIQRTRLVYPIWCCAFMATILLITIKISFNNPVYKFIGKNMLSLYLLHFIPINVLGATALAKESKYLFVILCIAVSFALAVPFTMLTDKVTDKIFNMQ
ncbi:MAG: hypothetical protein K6C14_08110 [Eubacterium sp.]|nr:hypothetical protein [Eubacterium sp.]